MSFFRSVRDLLKPPKESKTPEEFTLPYELSPGEWRKLKTLKNEEGWSAYLKALDGEVNLRGERILQTSNADAIHFMRGFVSGLRHAASVIDQISLREQHFERERQHRNESSERRGDNSTLFGSPGWRPQRQKRPGR